MQCRWCRCRSLGGAGVLLGVPGAGGLLKVWKGRMGGCGWMGREQSEEVSLGGQRVPTLHTVQYSTVHFYSISGVGLDFSFGQGAWHSLYLLALPYLYLTCLQFVMGSAPAAHTCSHNAHSVDPGECERERSSDQEPDKGERKLGLRVTMINQYGKVSLGLLPPLEVMTKASILREGTFDDNFHSHHHNPLTG